MEDTNEEEEQKAKIETFLTKELTNKNENKSNDKSKE